MTSRWTILRLGIVMVTFASTITSIAFADDLDDDYENLKKAHQYIIAGRRIVDEYDLEEELEMVDAYIKGHLGDSWSGRPDEDEDKVVHNWWGSELPSAMISKFNPKYRRNLGYAFYLDTLSELKTIEGEPNAWDVVRSIERSVLFDPTSKHAAELRTWVYSQPDICNEIAWELATDWSEYIRNGRQAFLLAGRAVQLTNYRDPGCLDTLAAAYAECGDFKSAVSYQIKALDLAPSNDKADFESRLRLYRAGRPYREY